MKPSGILGLLRCSATIRLISAIDGLGDTISSNGGRYSSTESVIIIIIYQPVNQLFSTIDYMVWNF